MPSRKGQCAAAIIPLGHGSHRDSSSLPEGCSQRQIAPSPRERAHLRKRSQRAGPALPSYLALHHAGFSVPPMLPPERWALTPPFHPCQTERAFEDVSQVFLRDATVLLSAGGIFSVALSVNGGTGFSLCSSFAAQTEVCATAPLALPGALPYFVTGSCEPTTTVSGLSSRPAILR